MNQKNATAKKVLFFSKKNALNIKDGLSWEACHARPMKLTWKFSNLTAFFNIFIDGKLHFFQLIPYVSSSHATT